MKKVFSIKGMHCNSCAQLIEKSLEGKVEHVSASYANESVSIDFNENRISETEIISILKKLGYEAKPLDIKGNIFLNNNGEEEKDKFKNAVQSMGSFEKTLFFSIIAIASILLLYKLIGFSFSNFNFSLPNIQIPELGERTSLILLFLAGILTGFHCISMCGGFVVSYTAKNALNGHKGFKQHLVYGGSKVMSYAIIGGIFGLIGGVFAFSIKLRGLIAVFAGIFMIFYALSMFGFKFFRRFQFNPKFLTKVAADVNTNTRGPFKAPFFTGLLNGLFLACGPLQAMYLYAMGTGSFFTGATSLAAFGLGTLPIMLGFGFLATAISHKTTAKILKISAVIVLILGLIMLNRGLALTGSGYDFDSMKAKINGNSLPSSGSDIINGVQEINMNVDTSGYSPNSFVLKKGVPVKWNIDVKQITGCNNPIVVPEYNLEIKLKQGMNTVEFTPDKAGTIPFSCWMGMLRGNFIVTEDGTATEAQITGAASASKAGGSCNMGAGGGSCGSGSCGGSGGCGCGG